VRASTVVLVGVCVVALRLTNARERVGAVTFDGTMSLKSS
jgi:hypothetical protein